MGPTFASSNRSNSTTEGQRLPAAQPFSFPLQGPIAMLELNIDTVAMVTKYQRDGTTQDIKNAGDFSTYSFNLTA